jgi:hypothetical protein
MAEFVRQASGICRTADQSRKRATEGLGEGEEGADPPTEMTALVSPVNTMVAELAALGEPKRAAAQIKAIISSFEVGTAFLEAHPSSPKVALSFAKADRLALGYGLSDCSI